MRKGGEILSDVLNTLLERVEEGVSELEIDQLAEKLILQKGADPGFKTVKGYRHSICTAVNDVVVHGIPSSYRFKKGDLVCIDAGVLYKGLHTDMAETILLKKGDKTDVEKHKFLTTGKKALEKALSKAKPGNRIGHISKEIQETVEGQGYSVVRTLVGHGVGKSLHEAPEVPGFLDGSIDKTPLLKENMTLAIEVIYNMGSYDVQYANNDGWTIATADSSLSAVFERSIVITDKGYEVLTK